MSPSILVDALLPMTSFVVMIAVGTDISADALRRGGFAPLGVATGTLGQVVALPALALAIVLAVQPTPALAIAFVLLSMCPGGALSNFYTFLNGGHVAFSIMLTVTSSVLVIATFPALGTVIFSAVDLGAGTAAFPAGFVLGQLAALVLAPVAIGAALRSRFERRVLAARRRLEVTATALVLVSLAVSLAVGWPAIRQAAGATAMISALFTLGALGIGRAVSLLLPERDRSACTIEFGVRNVPVAMMILTGAGFGAEAVGILACYFLLSAPIVIAYSLATRRRRAGVTVA